MKKKKQKKYRLARRILSLLLLAVMGIVQVYGVISLADDLVTQWREHRERPPLVIRTEEPVEAKTPPNKDYVGTCETEVFLAKVKVYSTDVLPSGVLGKFYFTNQRRDSGVIAVSRGDRDVIDTVAHEVSHFVDHVVGGAGINDTETRAYLQGYYTQCVVNLLSKTNG